MTRRKWWKSVLSTAVMAACGSLAAFGPTAVFAQQPQAVRVRFTNNASGVIQLYWLSEDKLTFYAAIKPGETYTQDTFDGHKWVAVLIHAQKAFTVKASPVNRAFAFTDNGYAG